MKERKELNVQIGRRIHLARGAAGMTQEKLSEKIGTSIQYLSDLERGNVGTSISTLIKICHALSVSSDYLLMGYDQDVKPLDLSVRLNALSPSERRLMEDNIRLMLEAFHVNSSNEKEEP